MNIYKIELGTVVKVVLAANPSEAYLKLQTNTDCARRVVTQITLLYRTPQVIV